MINQDIINYIKSGIANGMSKGEMMNSLVRVGWQTKDVQDSFDATYASLPLNTAYSHQASELITERNYSIQKAWIIKSFIETGFGVALMIFYFWARFNFDSRNDHADDGIFRLIFYFGSMLWGVSHITILALQRNFFHYSLEGNFIILKQGIVSRQERNIPYGVIQNIFVKQNLLDRIFNLSSLVIENASHGATSSMIPQQRRKQADTVGFAGNKVSIPGLKKEDAEALKNIILQRMKENPIEDSQSGL